MEFKRYRVAAQQGEQNTHSTVGTKGWLFYEGIPLLRTHQTELELNEE